MPNRGQKRLFAALMILTMVPHFHNNVGGPYLGLQREPTKDDSLLYASYKTLVVWGHRIAHYTRWAMFSPSPKVMLWMDWEASADGTTWHPLLVRNMSPEYRRTRSWWNYLFLDLKIGQLYDMMHRHAPRELRLRQGYASVLLCPQARKELFFALPLNTTIQIRSIYREIAVPYPGSVPGWTAPTAKPTREYYNETIPCPPLIQNP